MWVNLGSNHGDHRIYDPEEANRITKKIEVTTLDAVLPAGMAVAFAKMDSQGGEPLALQGVQAVLARSPEARLLEVDERSERRVAVDGDALLRRCPASADRLTNLLCLC